MSETNNKTEAKKYTLTESLGAFVPRERREYLRMVSTAAMLEPVTTCETLLRLAVEKHIHSNKDGSINKNAAGAFIQGLTLGMVVCQNYDRKDMQKLTNDLYVIGEEAAAIAAEGEEEIQISQKDQETLSKSMEAIFAGLETLKKFAINQKEASRGKNTN